MRIPSVVDLAIVAALSAAVALIVIVFAAIDPAQRSPAAFVLGAVALAGLVGSLFMIFMRGVDERLFRVSEYQRSRTAGESSMHAPGDGSDSTLWHSSAS